jgi:hypothetical protein
MEHLFATIQEKDKECIVLPIEKICGVKSWVTIEKQTKIITGFVPTIQFRVVFSATGVVIYEDEYPNTLDNLIALFSTFESIYYDKFTNKMYCEKSHISHFTKPLFPLLKFPSNFETKYQPCCVCMDDTSSKTQCGHPLCLVCWSSLKKLKCPLCRHQIESWESDEEEEE